MPRVQGEQLRDVWLTIAEAKDLGVSERTLRWQRGRGTVEQRVTNGRVEVRLDSLPSAAQEKFALRFAAATPAVAALAAGSDRYLTRLPGPTAAAMLSWAARRVELARAYEALDRKFVRNAADKYEPSPEAQKIFAAAICTDPLVLAVRRKWEDPLTHRTACRLLSEVRERGPRAALPRYCAADAPRRPTELTEEMVREIKALRIGKLRNLTVAGIHRELVKKHGVDQAPARSTVYKVVGAIPPQVLTWAVHGERVYDGTQAPPILREWDVDVYEWLCGDNHKFDLFAIDPARKGELFRPQVSMFIDLRSRAPAGWRLSFSPNSQTIAEAFTRAVLPKAQPAFANLCGLPTNVYIDNGKDFRAIMLEGRPGRRGAEGGGLDVRGLFTDFDVKVHHALPYNAKAKPVERWFGWLVQAFSRAQLTYCGNGVDAKPGRFDELKAQHDRYLAGRGTTPFLTLEQLEVLFEQFLVECMSRPHDGLYERESGRDLTPAMVAGMRRAAPRVPVEEQLATACWETFERTIRKGHLEIQGYTYTDDRFFEHERRRVRCRRDPRDVRRLLVWDAERGTFIGAVQAITRVRMSLSAPVEDKAFVAQVRTRDNWKKRTKDEFASILAEEAAGVTSDHVIAATRSAPPPLPAAAPPPSAAVITLQPTLAREVRELRALKPPEPEDFTLPPEELAAVLAEANAPRRELTIEEEIVGALGPRPPEPARNLPEIVQAKKRRLIADYDEMAAQVRADLEMKRETNLKTV